MLRLNNVLQRYHQFTLEGFDFMPALPFLLNLLIVLLLFASRTFLYGLVDSGMLSFAQKFDVTVRFEH
jgi:hypothetical protein